MKESIKIGSILLAFLASTTLVGVFSANAATPSLNWIETPVANAVSYSVIGESNMLSNFSGNVRVVVTSSNVSGLLKITTSTDLTTVAGYDNSSSLGAAGDQIAFEGSQDKANAALASLAYQGSAAQDDTVSITATDAGFASRSVVVDNTTTYHYYKAISGTKNWVEAFEHARDTPQIISGTSVTGWPVTIISAAENDFVSQYVSVDSWIGASDDFAYINAATGTTTYANQAASEGNWYWVVGEPGVKGTQFSSGNLTPVSVGSRYFNWTSGEPNNHSSGEHAGQLYVQDKKWNDLPSSSTQTAYIWEYATTAQLLTSSSVSKILSIQSSPPPVITSISPNGGTAAGGTVVTITGTGLNGASGVTFDGVAGTNLTVATDTQITVTTPVRSDSARTVGAAPVIVTTPEGSSNSNQAFTFRPVIDTSPAGWTSGTGLTLAELASRSKRKPVVRTTTAPFTTTGTDSRSGESYSFISNMNYGNNGAYAYESDERTRTSNFSFTRADSGVNLEQGKTNVITLNSSGTCERIPDGGSANNTKDGYLTYCSVFGPDVFSEPFYATNAQSISFDWKAVGGGDDYEIYAFLVALDNLSDTDYSVADHSIVTHGVGGSSDWATASTAIPNNGYYKFRFVNGSFDRTGGYFLGARLYIHNQITVGLSNVIDFPSPGDQIGASGTFNFTTSATSAGDVTVTSQTTSVCTVTTSNSGGETTVTVTKLSTGTCTLTASQVAIGSFAPAQNVVRSIVIRSAAIAPLAPTATSVTAGDQQLSINFIAGGNGGAIITNYAYSLDGATYLAFSPEQTASPLVITGLTGGTSYSVRIKAVNSVGQGLESNQVSGTPTGEAVTTPVPQAPTSGGGGAGPTTVVTPTPSPTPSPTPTRTPLATPTIQPTPPTNPLPSPTPTPTTQSTPQAGSPLSPAPLIQRTVEEIVDALKPVAFDALVNLITRAIEEIRSGVTQSTLVLLLSKDDADKLVSGDNKIILDTPTSVMKDGVAEPARIVVVDITQLQVVAGEGGLLTLEAKDGEDSVPVDSQGRLQMLRDNLVEAEGTGFAANSEFAVWLFSDPIMLGIGKTDAAGRFFASFPVEKDIPLGDHTLQVVGVTPTGEQRSISLPVVVLADKEAARAQSIENMIEVSQNPVQGWFDSINYLFLLLILLFLIGIWAIWASRREYRERKKELELREAKLNPFVAPRPKFKDEKASVFVAAARRRDDTDEVDVKAVKAEIKKNAPKKTIAKGVKPRKKTVSKK